MELFALDKDFNVVNQLIPSNTQWNRKYYEFGDFALQIPSSQYQKEMKYIYTKDREELGIINKVSYADESTSKNIMLIGYFAEKQLNDKIIYPTFYGSGEISEVTKKMINQFKEDIPINSIEVKANGSKVDFQETGAELGSKVNQLLQTQELAYKMVYNYERNELKAIIYQGLDRTQSQTINNFITFSTSWGNIGDVNADTDNSNYKNYAVVAGEGESEERIVVDVDLSNGGYKKKIFIDKRQTRFDPEKQTIDEYKLNLIEEGKIALLDYQEVINIEFSSNSSSYVYLVDFDLGDKCDIIIEDLGIIIEARIIAIYEVIKDNIHSITLEFGDKILNAIEKVERRIR